MYFKVIVDFIRKFFFLINILFSLYSLLVYQLVFTANIQHWLGGFLTLSFPVVIIIHFMFVIIWLLTKPLKCLLSLFMILMTYPILNRTFKFSLSNDKVTDPDLTVLSYNLMYLDYINHQNDKPSTATQGISQSMLSIEADIKCFQELYNDDRVNDLDMIKRLMRTHPFYSYVHSEKGNDLGRGSVGLATFSNYPIIHKEEAYWGVNNNGILATDIVVQSDTIRVINFQLRSMGIRVEKMIDHGKKINKTEAKNILKQLKSGFETRGNEVGTLVSWIQESPHPVIAVGDMNEIPYGYTYGKVRKVLNNAFEDAGSGFGFTYNKILGFLRIDNQFYDSKNLNMVKFKTLNSHKYSDHYPVYGEYDFKR